MSERRNTIAALVAGVMAVSCGDGTTEPPPAPEAEGLSAAESVALFRAIWAVSADTAATIIEDSGTELVIACPLGGQMTTTTSVIQLPAVDTLRLRATHTTTPRGCQVSGGGTRFTVDGSPGVHERVTVSVVGDLDAVILEGPVTGSLDWQSDGRSGACEIDLVLSGGLDPSGEEGVLVMIMAGTVCGHESRIEEEGAVLIDEGVSPTRVADRLRILRSQYPGRLPPLAGRTSEWGSAKGSDGVASGP